MSKAPRLVALLMLCVGGCAVFSKGHTHAEYDKATNQMTMTVASRAEQYALYVNNEPIASVVQDVKKGQPLGFSRTEEGRIRAVAGDYSTVLPRTATIARWTPMGK